MEKQQFDFVTLSQPTIDMLNKTAGRDKVNIRIFI